MTRGGRRSGSLGRAVALLAAATAALAACAQPQRAAAPAAPAARAYYVDQQGGARVCTVPQGPLTLSGGAPTEARMVVGNDGGWCGIAVAQPGPRPYTAGLVSARPAHGRLHVRTVGDRTRVDYIPDAGFAGSDSFAVNLLPGGAQLRVAVTVEPGPAAATAAAASAPTAASSPAASGPTRSGPAARAVPSAATRGSRR